MDIQVLLSAPPIFAVCVTFNFSIILIYSTQWKTAAYIILLTLAAGWNAGVASLFFIIADNGVGLSPKALARVFDAGVRPSPSPPIDSLPAGSGLGLILVKHFVETVGGSIHVHSVPKVQTEFRVHLPLPLRPAPEG